MFICFLDNYDVFNIYLPGYHSIDISKFNGKCKVFGDAELEEFRALRGNNDYLEVYDGGTSRALMGRYCGQRFPEFLQSSSNVMEIIFVSDEKITRAGLKLYYTSEKGKSCIKFMIKQTLTKKE